MSEPIDFLQAQADACRSDAAATTLAQVKARYLRSAAAWQSMADKAARTAMLRGTRQGSTDRTE